MARPLFAGLRPTTPKQTTWSFYIALRSLSSNSVQEARTLLLLKIFVPIIVLFAGKQPGISKGNSG